MCFINYYLWPFALECSEGHENLEKELQSGINVQFEELFWNVDQSKGHLCKICQLRLPLLQWEGGGSSVRPAPGRAPAE